MGGKASGRTPDRASDGAADKMPTATAGNIPAHGNEPGLSPRVAHLPLVRHSVTAAGRSWLIDAVADQDALLAASDQFDAFPYGLLLWDAAPVLADALAAFAPSGLEGKRVLELGAGVGLAGLAARHLGADVVQTDHAQEALELARRNATLNGIAGIVQQCADWTRWTDEKKGFDIVIGSDVLYDGSAHAPIGSVLAASLATDGFALLTDPGRTATPFFVRDMQAAGWLVSLEQRTVGALHPTRPGETVDVTILKVWR